MNESIAPIIKVSDLFQLYKSENVIIADVSNGKEAKSNYEAKHLDGAIFIDLNTQLADIKEDLSMGGRHPLPKMADFLETLSNLGISAKSHVIIYDDKNGANAAARFWWMLKAIGHEKVQVLDGGFQEAEKHEFPMSSKPTILKPTDSYQIDHWQLPIATIAEVENVSQSANHLVIDVREQARFNGETEPIDLIAGHIPGAKNVPFIENLDENGLFLTPNALKNKYENIFGNIQSENIIFHCGSGVTACHSLLAIAHAEMEIPKLYVGSWSEWSRNNKPIATNLP
uniref:sulfurtransferase n=1 Tax=Flavobacterium sp. TaxID=239 RepID=UPI004049C458